MRVLTEEFNLKLVELDLLSGGYPCQSFSCAGYKRGWEDARGSFFYEFAVFLKNIGQIIDDEIFRQREKKIVIL